MKFWKMQGCGNDFIVIDGRFDNRDDNSYSTDALKLCARKFSIGADGFIIVKDSNESDIKMVYYNSDGSRGEMCGNGIRCFSKYVFDNNIITKDKFTVETLGGVKEIILDLNNDNTIKSISVDMGNAFFEPELIPVHELFRDKSRFIDESITVLGKEFKISSILMGVPHTVIFVEDISIEDVILYGREIEKHEFFPKKTNVNFVKVIDKNNIYVKTWERGCGYTYGCGTGMTASAIISNYFDKTSKNVSVKSLGGSVDIKINSSGAFMSGTAEKVFEGTI